MSTAVTPVCSPNKRCATKRFRSKMWRTRCRWSYCLLPLLTELRHTRHHSLGESFADLKPHEVADLTGWYASELFGLHAGELTGWWINKLIEWHTRELIKWRTKPLTGLYEELSGTHQGTERVTQQRTEQVTQKEPDRVTYQGDDLVTRQRTEWFAHEVTDRVTHQGNERVTQQGTGRQVPWEVNQIAMPLHSLLETPKPRQ